MVPFLVSPRRAHARPAAWCELKIEAPMGHPDDHSLVEHTLLDYLVCPFQHRWGDREPKGLGRLDVNHELELRGLLHGQISRLSAGCS